MQSRGRTVKSKIGQKQNSTKAQKDQNQSVQNPQKWENILILQQSRCTIPWSHHTGVDNQHSRHAITWADRESKNGQKHHRTKAQKDQNQSGQNPQKMRKYFNTPTTKVYNPMINWYMIVHIVQVWTINILVMQSRGRTVKSKIGQKQNSTKAQKDQNQSVQNPQKWENILILQQSRCTIPWSRDIGVDNQHSRHAITWADRESKNGQKHHRTKAPKDQNQSGQTPP